MREYLLDTDAYNKPLVLKDKDALAVLLLRLLKMKPGDHPLHPEMGVDIVGRYRYCSAKDLPVLQREINNQISTYLPNYRTIDISVSSLEGEILVSINIDGTMFNYTTGESKENTLISLIA